MSHKKNNESPHDNFENVCNCHFVFVLYWGVFCIIDGLWSPSETLVDQVGGVRSKAMFGFRPTWFYIFYFDTLFILIIHLEYPPDERVFRMPLVVEECELCCKCMYRVTLTIGGRCL